MNTNNENRQENSKNRSNYGAGRDGKPFEKRDVKSVLKGSRGGDRFKPKSYGDKNRYSEQPDNKRNSYNQSETGRNRYDSKENRSGGFENRNTFEGRRENRDYSKPYDSRPYQSKSYESKPYERKYNNDRDSRSEDGKLSFKRRDELNNSDNYEGRINGDKKVIFRKPRQHDSNYDPNAKYSHKKRMEYQKETIDLTKPVRLNKFLANAGICSRRDADEYIKAGVITVNGQVVTELGVKILPTDKVLFHDQAVQSEKKVYLLLNKPKDCVTTSEDKHAKITVLDLVKNACSERIYPVGRLDRNTTGVLLLTNDGDLASKLTHPKYDKKKIYHVTLDKALTEEDFKSIQTGVELEDGMIAADSLEYVMDDNKKQVGIEIHSGKNRVVRRIFDKLGYKVIRLDRVYFAGLTKKNLPRGKYRFLNEREVAILKMGAHE